MVGYGTGGSFGLGDWSLPMSRDLLWRRQGRPENARVLNEGPTGKGRCGWKSQGDSHS